jgi:hypothetical protein
MQEMVKEWVIKMTSPSGETLSKELEGSYLPVYIVDCPKLHVIPSKYLEYRLRWCDKWAYESVKENSPIVNWKEGTIRALEFSLRVQNASWKKDLGS